MAYGRGRHRLIYGMLLSDLPLIIANLITLCLTGAILAAAPCYRAKSAGGACGFSTLKIFRFFLCRC